ncbi:MAG: S41 family peptidase [Caldilineaceae bacterium]|nr:S41 family peptidase [Caldilineaceae bacterium]MCB9138940.1 S41 family peptidase [Caldilineaceae bacterium]
MKRPLLWIIGLLIFVVSLAGAFGAGALFGATLFTGRASWSRPVITSPVEEPEEFNVFWQAWSIVQDRFVDQEVLDDTQLTYGAIQGMLNSLGDQGHTVFLTPEEMESQREDLDGTFSGIGASIGVQDGMPVIIAPFDGSPAAEAGIKAGDIITAVDGEDTAGRDLNDVVETIRGPAGTEVVLSVLRLDGENTDSYEIPITRGEIEIPAADWAMIPGTDAALIRLSQFNANADDDLRASIEAADAAGATSLVLDLRNNPGGLLDQAIRVTSEFLEDGNVLQEADAEGNIREYKVRRGGIATEIPMAVLINAGSASSAEILAGALQDYGRAELVGETTFGTGTVLEPFPLSDGSAIMLGTRQWLTAEGRTLRKQGVSPDEEVILSVAADLLTANELEEMSPEEVRNSEDLQLLKALEVLGEQP